MVSFRNMMAALAVTAIGATMATSAQAGWCNGYYGCGPGNYGYGWSSGVPIFGYPYPVSAERGLYLAPRRYFVDQGPRYTGPNVTFFFPPVYNPGGVNTFAYPYVGRRVAWAPRRHHHWRHGHWR
jgi:hypothetical protein